MSENSVYRILHSSFKFLFLTVIILFSACGKIGDPLPPIPKAPLIVTELTAIQQGTNIIVNFPVSKATLTDKLKRVDIYRAIENIDDPQGLTVDDFMNRARVIESLNVNQLAGNTSQVSFTDPIDFKITNDRTRFRYAVRLVNLDDRPADLSNYGMVAPLSLVAEAPVGLSFDVTQRELIISWQAPKANLNGSSPANVLGYNLYRKADTETIKLNKTPLLQPSLTETQFQFNTKYQYFVRALSLPRTGAPASEIIESNPSEILTVTPKDTFPPVAPTSITIASRGGLISIFWPANAEPDVIGYNIYRSDDEKTWAKITGRPITTITFSDKQVKANQKYFYQITAVDNAGNESPRSETLSEITEPS
jgi:hypothetical protein